MKTYSVAIPITGVIYTEVQAEDEEAAIDLAMETTFTLDDIDEWELHRRVVEGNVCHAHTSRASAEEI